MSFPSPSGGYEYPSAQGDQTYDQGYSQDGYQQYDQGYQDQTQYAANEGYDQQGGEYYDQGQGQNFANQFEAQEELNGVRFSWNEWPVSKVEAERAVVPVGALYSPLKDIENLPVVQYAPIRCHNSNCGAVLNPWCSIDLRSKLWTCPFCLSRNQFPSHYAEHITETNLPAELMGEYTTIEYELQHKQAGSPIFFFLIDTCISEEELDHLKDSIAQSIRILPDDALVGLISFGTLVQVHELGFSDLPKSFVFRGKQDLPVDKLAHLLGIRPLQAQAGQQGAVFSNRFILPVSECLATIDTILENMKPDPWPVKAGQRGARCTGVALGIAVSILEKLFTRRGARIMLFVGGPPTIGDGSICSRELKEALRSHTDISKGRAPMMKDAKKFYETLANRCVTNCHAVDLFASSLDQIGVLEMRSCMDWTGGLVVLADSFGQSVFKESFRRVFARDDAEDAGLKMGLAGTIEMITGKEFKVRGAIGSCKTLNKKSSSVSDNPVGEAGTYAWRLCAFKPETTIAFYFDIVNDGKKATHAPTSRPHLQFVTEYQHANGTYHLRVTTVAATWQQNPQNVKCILPSFDQEAAAVIIARAAVNRAETEEIADILRWLDRSLIRLCSRFAQYQPDSPQTFQLPQELSIYPQFMFNLRRSPFLQVFNSSPDEACYKRMVLIRENTRNSLVMIQATLLSYSFHGPPEPVLLDVSSIQHDTILLLDTFFHVVVFHGETIASWRDQRYQDSPEHENFKQLLQAPREDAQALMEDRFPVPRYIVCDQHKSQSRFILAKLNPSVSNNPDSTQQVFTDDVSLKVFMESLMRLAVQS